MSWFTKPVETKLALGAADIRKLLRILFIDDEEMPMAAALRQQGYNTFQVYDLTSLAELEKQEYHLIFCDIRGVGAQLSKDEGAGLIKLIKEQVRYPIVIAYSADGYQPGSEHERTMRTTADDIVRKDAALDEYIRVVNKWGSVVFSTERCASTLAALLHMSETEAARIVTQVAAKGRASPDWLRISQAGGAVKTVLDLVILVANFAGA